MIKLGLIGYPLGHSLSPKIHAAALKACGLDGDYSLFPIEPDDKQPGDVFRGKNVPEGRKSLAYAFTYRNAERTLTDAEVNAAHEKLVAAFQQSLQAVLREW